jgi:F-type H+-transporting ATPase subunit delta
VRPTTLAKRYAKALFELAVDHRVQDQVLSDLRALVPVFQQAEVMEFANSPLIAADVKMAAIKAATDQKGLSKDVFQFLQLLAGKNRLGIYEQVVEAYQAELDAAHNVSRGVVRSATALGPSERQQLEQSIERVLAMKVILNYKVDPSVIGGLVAQVGSYTFDDSVASHLKRLSEELNRRTV